MYDHLATLTDGRTGRCSSWDTTGRNQDRWLIGPGETRVLADIEGPGVITHLWFTQRNHYRECLLRITWDDAPHPSVVAPLGDFFCLGHGIVANFQSALFTASTNHDNRFDSGCALNCYVPMPFRRRALVELVNESSEEHLQYFYVDYERLPEPRGDAGYFHAEFRRANPFGGWGHEITVNTKETDIVNRGRTAWENNYVILDTRGRGHYLGCNLSVTNFQGTWWGEGDDMIWVDGYRWPPDLHGTGSEDYLGQAWGMQDNAFLRNGSSMSRKEHRRLPDQLCSALGEPGALPQGDQGHDRARARQPPGKRNVLHRLLVRLRAMCGGNSAPPGAARRSACRCCATTRARGCMTRHAGTPGATFP